MSTSRAFGVVAIGRNEGARLQRCIESVRGLAARVVYVDSGSTDGSVALARSLGVETVELDLAAPFTAARARNAGFRRLQSLAPELAYVQFVDGDCEVIPGWLEVAVAALEADTTLAAVCGRRRERYPERSVYNRMCDVEWNTPVGVTKGFGGDVMLRVAALVQAGGYRDDLIAGEDSEFSVRLRMHGHVLRRLDADMTLHDAGMTRIGQWWRRTYRAGYAFASGVALHGAPPERFFLRESRSAWLWGATIPLGIAVLALLTGPYALLAFLVYPMQVLRLYAHASGEPSLRVARAFFLLAGKFAEAAGQVKFLLHRMAGKTGRLIEYK